MAKGMATGPGRVFACTPRLRPVGTSSAMAVLISTLLSQPRCMLTFRCLQAPGFRPRGRPIPSFLSACSARRRLGRQVLSAVHDAGSAAGGSGVFPPMTELNPFPAGSRHAELADELLRRLQIDDAQQRERIEQTPQGTQAWLDARKYRLTASNFGAAAGRNRFRSPEELAHEMLHGEFKGNDATRWGSEKEPVALADYVTQKQAQATSTQLAAPPCTTPGCLTRRRNERARN